MSMKPRPEKRLNLYTMDVKWTSDVERLKRNVEKVGGSWQGVMSIDFMNVWNQPISVQYHCVYYAFEEVEMEVGC